MNTVRCVLVLLGLSVAVPAWAETPARSITVPFELLRTGHMAVRVKINGKGPYRLIFDTGAPITLLNNKVAREAGLLRGVRAPAFTFFGSMGEVRVRNLEVGGQKAEDVPAVVMDHPTVEAISRALGPIEGIVGFPFFARFKTTVDYQARTLTFVPNGFKPPDVLQGMIAALAGEQGPKVLEPAGQWGLRAQKDRSDDEPGVTVAAVLPGSPAARGGLKAGDRLLTLDGRWTDSLADLYIAASHVKPGRSAAVRVRRDGKELSLEVRPAAGL